MLEAPCKRPNKVAEGDSITGIPWAKALSLRAPIQGMKIKAAEIEQSSIANNSQRISLNLAEEVIMPILALNPYFQ